MIHDNVVIVIVFVHMNDLPLLNGDAYKSKCIEDKKD
jgi:hypothetical protein